jgi:hypothetical protein
MDIGGVNKKKPRKARKSQQPRRPVRQKKSDRLLHGDQEPNTIMADYALAPLDRLALDMDRRWGIDMLPELVSAETAMKYGSAMSKLNAAINDSDPAMVRERAEIAMRGLVAMDKEAEALGAQRASTDVWEVQVDDGVTIGIMRDGRSWQTVKEQRPDLNLVTLREVAVALQFFNANQFISETKKNFPDADVIGISKNAIMDGEIPF